VVVLFPTTAIASGLSIGGVVSAGSEIDSNPERLSGDTSNLDLVERLFIELSTTSSEDRHTVSSTLRAGAKKFHETDQEDTFVIDFSAAYHRLIVPHLILNLGVSGRDRTERGHQRDYARVGATGGLTLDWEPIRFRVGGGYHYFLYKPVDTLSSGTLSFNVGLVWQPTEIIRVTVGYYFGKKGYGQDRLEEQGLGLTVVPGEGRSDGGHTVSTSLDILTSFLTRLEVSWQRNESNSFGKSFSRLVARLAFTFSLPAEIFVSARTSVQRTTFDEGILIDPTLTVDDENRNTLELVISRDIVEWLGVEMRYSLYLQEFGGDDAEYQRHLIYAGLTAPF